ncbi:MAG: crosslink repair DNA glycosylase YcaQ family protein [Pseudomonadota bacterium]
MLLHLDNSTARHVVLGLQGLADRPDRAFAPGGLAALIDRLGFVQLDSIRWVERAQHMTLFARNQTYRPRDLDHLYTKERGLFENWTHDSSVIPARFYPYWRHKFARKAEDLNSRFCRWQGDGFATHCQPLLERITTDGELRSRDLEQPEGQRAADREMWQWHDGKAALEYLWRTGELGIARREGFQKVYDLPGRCLHAEHLDRRVSEDEFIDWACSAALDRLGFGTAGDIARYFDLVTIAEAKAWLEEQSTNRVIDVAVEAVNGQWRPLHARADIASVIADLPPLPTRIRALSPFDPVIRDRKRLVWLFGFDYRIEIYVPAEKRVWGYYVFPLLEGDRLVGRIDMRAVRDRNSLQVKRLWWEPKVKAGAGRMARLDAELVRQCRLADVSEVVWLEGSRSD